MVLDKIFNFTKHDTYKVFIDKVILVQLKDINSYIYYIHSLLGKRKQRSLSEFILIDSLIDFFVL